MGRVDGNIRVIAKNSEKYISVEKSVCIGEYEKLDENGKPALDENGKPIIRKDIWYIRFIDSCAIAQGKLEDLVKNLPRDKFKILRKKFSEENFKGRFDYVFFACPTFLENKKYL